MVAEVKVFAVSRPHQSLQMSSAHVAIRMSARTSRKAPIRNRAEARGRRKQRHGREVKIGLSSEP